MVLRKLCEKAATIVRMRGVACLSLGIADDRLHLRAVFHQRAVEIPDGLSIPLDGSSDISVASATAMSSGHCVTCDTAISFGPLTISGPSIIAPIVWRRAAVEEGDEPIERPIGTMMFWGPKNGDAISDVDVSMAEAMAKQSSSILVEERLIEIDGASVAFSSVPVALILIDRDDRILLVNPMAERVLDGHLDGEPTLIEIDRGCQLSSMVHRARVSSDGSSSSSFTTSGGETFSATAQVARGGNCVISLSKVHISNAAEQLVGQVAHELRTPLTVIQGNVQTVEMLMDVPLADGDVEIIRELLGTAVTQCNRMTRQISEILNVARIQAGRQVEIRRSEFDLSAAIGDLLVELGDHLSRHVMDVDLPASCMISADHDKVLSVVDNMIRNAVKYSAPGRTIGLRVFSANGHIGISVTDEGIGIPPEAIERIGREPGFRTDESRQQADGIGLGMVYVRRVVEGHGGTLHITSELGRGSRFTVEIPIVESDGCPTVEL